MRRPGVRGTLTLLVGTLTALIVVLTATFGMDRIESSLVAAEFDERAADGESMFLDVDAFGEPSPEFDDWLWEQELEFLIPELLEAEDDLTILDAARSELGLSVVSPGGRLGVITDEGEVLFGPLDGGSIFQPGDIDSAAVQFLDLMSVLWEPDETEWPRLEFDLEWDSAIRTVGGIESVVLSTDVASITDGVAAIRRVLWTISPLLIALAALTAWLLTGRALRPVRAISRQAAAISGGTLHERVPVPGTEDEIAELASTVNAMLGRIQNDSIRRRRFVADASHELRTPVTILRSAAEVNVHSASNDEQREFAGDVLAESLRMGQIVEDLLALARSDEPDETDGGQHRTVDLDDVIRDEVGRPRSTGIDASGVTPVQVVGDPVALGRLVAHLLDNADRHAAARIRIELRAFDGEAELLVDDDGAGIPEADRERVFERFTRLDDARTRDAGGSGLGLAVVSATAGAHGGRVEVVDSPLGGGRFRVVFPTA